MEWDKILLADDFEIFLELEKTFYRRHCVELLIARNGHQAFSMAVAERPGLVIMNLDLPGISGDECCRRLKAHPDLNKTPVFLVAAGAHPEAAERGRLAGCDELFTKPIPRQNFLDAAGRRLGITQRSDPRIEARMRVHYGTGNQQLLANYSVNLSSGGIFIETHDILPVDTPLALEFTLPGSPRTIRCKGRVAWVNIPGDELSPRLPPGMGIQFVDLSLTEMHAIKDFVQKESLSPCW